MHQCDDYHVVSFAESLLIRERNLSVETFSASQGRRCLFASAPPSSKSVKGSHRGVLAAHRSSLQLGAMVANVDGRQISALLLKQRREIIIAADWNMVPEQETTGFFRLVGTIWSLFL